MVIHFAFRASFRNLEKKFIQMKKKRNYVSPLWQGLVVDDDPVIEVGASQGTIGYDHWYNSETGENDTFLRYEDEDLFWEVMNCYVDVMGIPEEVDLNGDYSITRAEWEEFKVDNVFWECE